MQISLDVKMGHCLITGFIKMEITYTCNDYSLDIDGKEFVDIDYDKQKEICHKLVDKVPKEFYKDLQKLLVPEWASMNNQIIVKLMENLLINT